MCFKITRAQREYYRYTGVSGEVERQGYGSSRPDLAWANRQKQHELTKAIDDQNEAVEDLNSDSN